MDLQEIPCAQPTSSALRRLLCGHNPFFLFSALCMLFGIFSLNNSLTWSPLPKYNLLWLILILNSYELLLVGLGIFLIRRGQIRDGITLLVLEAVFLADCGFLNSEIFTADFVLGLVVNFCMFTLAAAKLAFIFRGLGLSLRRDPRYGLILLQILFLLMAPGYFRNEVDSHHGGLLPITLFGAWWFFGLIIAVYLPMLNPGSLPHHRLIGTFVYVTMISIVAHLCTAGWVYHVRWYWANLTPLVLGISLAIGLSDHHVRHLALRMRLNLILPVIAILLSTENASALTFTLSSVLITPIRAAFLGATTAYLICVVVHMHPWFAVAALMCPVLVAAGKDFDEMSRNKDRALQLLVQVLDAMIPTTLKAWGLLSVIAAFLLLGIGVLSSLRKPVDESPDS